MKQYMPIFHEERNKPVFTMIELMLVIAIILILTSMLLPALRQARETAKAAACKGNIAQTVKASIAYANDYDGWHCPLRDAELGYPAGESTRWYAGKRLGSYIGLKEPGRTNNLNGTVFMCPSVYSGPLPLHPKIGRLIFFRLRCSQIDAPSRRAFMADDNHYYFNAASAWNEGIHIPPTATYRLHHRHNRRGNYGYFDGHVQTHDEFGAHDADMCNRFKPLGDSF